LIQSVTPAEAGISGDKAKRRSDGLLAAAWLVAVRLVVPVERAMLAVGARLHIRSVIDLARGPALIIIRRRRRSIIVIIVAGIIRIAPRAAQRITA